MPSSLKEPVEVTTFRFRVAEMDCASCVRKLQDRLQKLDGVSRVDGSPVARVLTVETDPRRTGMEEIRREAGRLGYLAHPVEGRGPRTVPSSLWRSSGAAGAYGSMALFVAAGLLRLLGVDPHLLDLPFHPLHLPDLLFIGAALVGGWSFFPKGIRAARTLSLDMNFLMTIAVLGAMGIGEYMEGAAIAFLFSLASLLENYAVDRARASVEALIDLAPDAAWVVRDGEEVRVSVDELTPGDLVVVRPGERVPADGTVEDGTSAVDESPITGEAMPVGKRIGDSLFAGTINREGSFRMRVTKPASESALSRIIRLVEQAEARKTRSERFVERFARYYTPAVTMGALLLMTLPPILAGAPFDTWFVRGLTLLVIACPCALVISTPVAVVSGITAAARNGVLIKGGTYLEAMGEVRAMALDKTGTLTVGHPRVAGVHLTDGVSGEELLSRAAAVEGDSEHPIARAIRDAAVSRGIEGRWRVTGFTAEPGMGARAQLDGMEHSVGRPEFLEARGAAVGTMETVPREIRDRRGSFVGVAEGGRVLGWLALTDPPRVGAAEAVAGLRAAGVERIVLLTGDRPETAEEAGRLIGVDEVRAGLLPEEKVEAVKALEREYGSVAMVGDGVNDAPALAAATVGVAMGAAGSDTALETADVALMGDDLSRLQYLYTLSHKAGRVIRQNIVVAIGVKAVLAIGVPLGMVSLITAVVVGDLGISLAVTLNAFRLARVQVDSPPIAGH